MFCESCIAQLFILYPVLFDFDFDFCKLICFPKLSHIQQQKYGRAGVEESGLHHSSNPDARILQLAAPTCITIPWALLNPVNISKPVRTKTRRMPAGDELVK